MIDQFREFPYYPTFAFSSIAAGTNNNVQLLIPHNIAVYGISIQATDLPSEFNYQYTIQFQDYESGDTLFDEPILAFNIQSDVRGFIPGITNSGYHGGAFILPSKWFIKKNQKLICKLNTMAGSDTENYYVTLLGYTTDQDPNPGIQPFVYSFPMQMGYQDNVSGGQTTVNFNQQVTNTLAKPMKYDFELHAITFDPCGTRFLAAMASPSFSIQISWPGRKICDRLLIDGVWGGGTVFAQGVNFSASGTITGFPINNVLQYKLPVPELIPRNQIVRVDISPAVTYIGSDALHDQFNNLVCTALIGNHIG